MRAFHVELEARKRTAFSAGFSIAVTDAVDLKFEVRARAGGLNSSIVDFLLDVAPFELSWQFVILAPGERPPPGDKWTLYRPDGSAHVYRRSP